MIEIYGADYEIQSTRWLGREGTCVAIQFPRNLEERICHTTRSSLDLVSRHEVFDQRVALPCRELASEHQGNFPNGMLFSEGLSIALIGLLRDRYAPEAGSKATSEPGISSVQRKQLVDLIESELGGTLRVASMAKLIGMSPSLFTRRFKASFGLSPHQYTLKRRLEVAAEALQAEPTRSVADVAFAFGFSSQAHFGQAFRRRMGCTPSEIRHADAHYPAI